MMTAAETNLNRSAVTASILNSLVSVKNVLLIPLYVIESYQINHRVILTDSHKPFQADDTV